MEISRLLDIAGSDSAGGAGIQADIATSRIFDVFPLCAISCITSQSARGLRMVESVGLNIFADQIDSAFEDFTPDAIKIGMLPTRKHAHLLLDKFGQYDPLNIVLDPIMAPTLGNSGEMQKIWTDPELLNRAADYVGLVTPNLPEALKMLEAADIPLPEGEAPKGCEPTSDNLYYSEEERAYICKNLSSHYGFANVLLKGGHSRGFIVEDTMLIHHPKAGEIIHHFEFERTDSRNTHGTGCALSTAIASLLAKGYSIISAIDIAEQFLHSNLERFKDIEWYKDKNSGHGPTIISTIPENQQQ